MGAWSGGLLRRSGDGWCRGAVRVSAARSSPIRFPAAAMSFFPSGAAVGPLVKPKCRDDHSLLSYLYHRRVRMPEVVAPIDSCVRFQAHLQNGAG